MKSPDIPGRFSDDLGETPKPDADLSVDTVRSHEPARRRPATRSEPEHRPAPPRGVPGADAGVHLP